MKNELIIKAGNEISKTVAVMAMSFVIGASAMAGAVCAASMLGVNVVIGYDKDADNE